MSQMPPLLGLAIVGCGGAAVDVVRSLAASELVRVVAVHDHDAGRSADLATASGGTDHATLDALLADPAVEAVYVALPHDLLAPTAIAALRAGRHVIVEKPVATSLAGIDDIRAAAGEAGREVGVMFELRQVASALLATSLVAGGAIGPVRLIRVRTLIDKPAAYWTSGPTGRVADPWRASRARAGGGVVLMNAIHQLDLVRAITGLGIVRVTGATAAGVAGVEVEDVAVATLTFDSGALGTLVASAHAPGAVEDETIEIDGDAGSIRLGDPYAPVPGLELYLRRPWAGHTAGTWIPWRPPAGDPWAATVESFARSVRAGEEPRPGLADAAAALEAVLAIYRSAETGRVVDVGADRPPARSSTP